MSDVSINYKGSSIATMSTSGTKTLGTEGKYCEDDIEVVYTKPSPNLQAKTNINASTSSQTIQPDEGYDGLSSVQINALDGQAAQTIHPSTSDQTIASGKYLTGAQTVKGVLLTNLSAGNIKKDVVVKVGDSTDDDCVTSVTGTYEGGGGGSGVVFRPMDYSVTVQNGKTSGNITFNCLWYDSDILLVWGGQAAVSVGSTRTESGCATDGTHFWIRAMGATTVTYNGSTATFTRNGNASVIRIDIPTGFDGTVPFVLS